VLDRAERFEGLRFPDADERIMTRLGEEGALLGLDPSTVGPFGKPVSRIALPARWSRGVRADDETVVDRDGEDLLLCVADRRFRYSRAGLEQVKDTSLK